jgi:hypothetical protein
MLNLLKLQIVVASMTTIGVWSNLYFNYKFRKNDKDKEK